MSETDRKGYYTCLGVGPWATAAEIRAAYHRCAKLWHPDVDPRSEAKARFQAVTEAYQILINPLERATYDKSARAALPQSYTTRPSSFIAKVAELVTFVAALRNRRAATLLLLGVVGVVAVLLVEIPRGVEDMAPPLPELAPAFAALEARTPSDELVPTSFPKHQPVAANPARSDHPSPAPVPPPSIKSEPSAISGAWLFRDPSNQKPPISLLTREEARETQRDLIERGYLVGHADGVWGPRSQSALDDFRRAQGLASDQGWTGETPGAAVSQTAQAAGFATEKAGSVEQASTPGRVADGPGEPDTNDSAEEIAEVAPEPRASGQVREIGAGGAYVGAWAPSRSACGRTEVPPLAISAQRASSFGGLAGECEFGQVRREGDGWRTRAQCFADGKRWTANVHLKATGSTLIWSSERGRATYYRCG